MSSKKSAIWLGVQGILALVRVSIWVIDPVFDDLERGSEDAKTWHSEPFVSMSEEKLLLLRLSRLKGSKSENHTELYPNSLIIPNWALDVLDLNETKISRAFELAYSLFSENHYSPEWAKALQNFRNARRVWDFPDGFMDWWIDAHVLHAFKAERPGRRHFLGCRIIEDDNGRYHYLPYYQRLASELKIFGDPRVEDKTIYTSLDATTEKNPLAHSQCRVGWPPSTPTDTMGFVGSGRRGTGLSLQRLNTSTPDSISKVTDMWDDIVAILRREKTVVFRKQAQFLKDRSDMGLCSKLVERSHLINDSDIEASNLQSPRTRQGTLRKISSMSLFNKARTM